MSLQSGGTSDAVEWIKLAAASALGFLGSLVTFRLRLYQLKRDIDDEKLARANHKQELESKILAIESQIASSVQDIKKSIEDGRSRDVAAEMRGDRKTEESLNAIRRDNDLHHSENVERLRIMRLQIITVVQLVAKIARATSGINQDDVDTMMGRVLAAEVERD
jgi:hypothetical protein